MLSASMIPLVAAPARAEEPKSIYEAARDGDLQTVKQLVAQGVDVNAADPDGGTPPLHFAAANGHDAIVQFLIAHGADVNQRSLGRGEVPLDVAKQTSTLELLVDAGADVNAHSASFHTPLQAAIGRGDLDAARFLIDHGATVNPRNPYGLTPLHTAVEFNRPLFGTLLLERGADVNARTSDGETALHAAAERCERGFVNLLIHHGAEVNAEDSRRETPLIRAAKGPSGECDRVASLLLGHGAETNATDMRAWTPLHAATLSQNAAVVKLLLDHGANVNAAAMDGRTPLHVAADRGDRLIASMLLDHGAEVNSRTHDAVTPLHEAARSGDVSVITLLLDRGADPLAKANGATPLNRAIEYHRHDAGVLLRERQLAALEKQAGPQPTPTPWVDTDRAFKGAMFSDMDHGYVLGTGYMRGESSMLATQDGGKTWRVVMDFPHYRPANPQVPDVERQDDQIWDVAFLDAQCFWVRTLRGQIHRTTDGGRTFEMFTPTLIQPFTKEPITSWVDTGMQFVTPAVGWTLAAASLHKTTDAGKNWKATPVPRSLGSVLQFWFFDESVGIAATSRGFQGVVRTTDGGATWSGVPQSPTFDRLACTRSGFCAGLGVRPNSGSFVVMSRDHGLTWHDTHLTLLPGDEDRIETVEAVAPNLIVLVGLDEGYNVDQMRDQSHGGSIVFSPPYPRPKGLLLRWDGSKWTRTVHPQAIEGFSGVYFLDGSSGWFTADRRGLYKTTDGGITLTYVADYFHQIAALTPSPTPFGWRPTPPHRSR